MYRSWKFVVVSDQEGERARWSWARCRGGVAIEDSTGTFPEFSACVFDAVAHGYVKGDPFEVIRERRAARRVVVTECRAHEPERSAPDAAIHAAR